METNFPTVDASQEIRFAVVMYGGISLAIYMNGIAQELLKLVRATATDETGDFARRREGADGEEGDACLRGTEVVYRKLGQILSRGQQTRHPDDVGPDHPIKTRFIVDILSGSSAGGINAVYLAKALANDQRMDGLKRLWTTEGDIGVLINDEASTRGTPLSPQDPVRSPLNGERMYLKLLEAFHSMDGTEAQPDEVPWAATVSPNVAELDLFVTATDIRGETVPVQLADAVVPEQRHRRVLRFRYSVFESAAGRGPRNDFTRKHNPLLAFAARCTSAHPAAFDPMRLRDMDPVLKTHPDYEAPEFSSESVDWQPFYGDDGPPEPPQAFRNRHFSDGGILDNRPFRHAIEAISSRSASVPVERKLVYLDPAPELPPPESEAAPGFLRNAWLSLSPLPRSEPIREDIQRVLDRNRAVERVERLISAVEGTLVTSKVSREEEPSFDIYTATQWDELTVSQTIPSRGYAWVGYHRLRVINTTDELARVVAGNSRFREHSDEFRAVRKLVYRWRRAHYHPDAADGLASENRFLRLFDYDFRVRLVRFLLTRIDAFYGSFENVRAAAILAIPDLEVLSPSEEPEVREALREARRILGRVHAYLIRERERLRTEHEGVRRLVQGMAVTAGEVRSILDPLTGERAVDEVFAARAEAFDEFGDCIQSRVREVMRESQERILQALAPSLDPSTEKVREILRYYYYAFLDYDSISYPILHNSGLGDEISAVDVFRISPEDATARLRQTPERPKLAGTKVNNFGAFFERKFRVNDILWGQLDGAERIIATLLRKEEERDIREALIDEAHRRILSEYGYGSGGEDAVAEFERRYEPEYEDTRTFDTESLLKNSSRASRVVGKVLEDDEASMVSSGAVWVTRVARFFWGMVEIAVPGSLRNLLWRHWLKLLYLVETLAIILGTLLTVSVVQQLGLTALAITAVIHGGVLFLGYLMRDPDGDPERSWKAARALLLMLGALLALLGLSLPLAALGVEPIRGLVGQLLGADAGSAPLWIRAVFATLFTILGIGLWVGGELLTDSWRRPR